MRDLSIMKYPAASRGVIEFLSTMLAPHIQRALEVTPTMLYSESDEFHWPMNADGNPQVYFALPRMLTTVFGYSGPCNVKWSNAA